MANDMLYIHKSGDSFKRLPEIYQIELTNACNLKCPMCLRTTDMVRDDQLFQMSLLKKMHEQGDFEGSYYVELQMAGEPTLHPKLGEIIDYLHDEVGVMVGLSTHGLLIKKKPSVLEALCKLDALTISVDSMDPMTYEKLRYPAKLHQLKENLECLFNKYKNIINGPAGGEIGYRLEDLPFTELQFIDTQVAGPRDLYGEIEALREWLSVNRYEDLCSIRTTADCFQEMSGRAFENSQIRNMNLCLNPWQSVSVSCTGDVLSCCFIFDPKPDEINYYGNLKENSLKEIWNSDRVTNMQLNHRDGVLEGQCKKCYLKSPVLIHLNILSRLVRWKKEGRY